MRDGAPVAKIVVSTRQLAELTAFTPQWVGYAIGPKIPFTDQRVVVDVTAMYKPRSRDEAEESLRYHMQATCEQGGVPYDENEWKIVRLELVGGN